MKRSKLKSITIKSMIILVLITAMTLHYSCEDDEPVVLLEEVSLSKTALVLDIGEVSPIIASATPENTTENLTWNSNNEQIALVQQSENGLVVGVKGVSVGSATLTAKNIDGNLIKTTDIRVIRKVKKLEFTATPIINVPSITLGFILTPLDATNQSVVWSSSDDSVATVSSNGLVTAIAVGKVDIILSTVPTTDEPQITIIKTLTVILENGVPVLEFDYCLVYGTIPQHGDYWVNAITTSGAVQNLNFEGTFTPGSFVQEENAVIPIYKLYDDVLIVNPGAKINFTMTYVNQWNIEEDASWVRSLVFIDWGNDTNFSTTGDLVAIIGEEFGDDDAPTNRLTNSFSVIVPQGATSGTVKMRVVTGDAYDVTPDNLNPCGFYNNRTQGFQDFNVTIQLINN